MTDKIKSLMEKLDISEVEAVQLIEDDKSVDRMTKMSDINSDLTDDQKKAQKKARQGQRKVSTTPNKREKKVDTEKAELIKLIFAVLSNSTENAEIVKAEREISFSVGENDYSLTLTKHRKK